MAAVDPGTIGVTPPGALGVSLFYHLTKEATEVRGDVFFVERPGSQSCAALREREELLIADSRGLRRVPGRQLFHADLLSAFDSGRVPEILIACPNPDQLLSIITACVQLLERSYAEGQWPEPPLPFIILSANGIYFQRLRQIFLEKLEEATLLGRLPDLWPEIMPRLVGRLLRGVTIQTGLREGMGGEAVYRPGPKGITRLAGGDKAARERCLAVLTAKGGWYELAQNSSATRLEFDKAMINLVSNSLGQIYAIDEQGNFRALQIREIVTPAHREEIHELAWQVFRVGRAVKAYAADENFEAAFARVLESLSLHETHVPSSLQWVGLRLRQRRLQPELTPTEAWLIEPLIRYARASELEQTARYFEELKRRLKQKLALAATRKDRADEPGTVPR